MTPYNTLHDNTDISDYYWSNLQSVAASYILVFHIAVNIRFLLTTFKEDARNGLWCKLLHCLPKKKKGVGSLKIGQVLKNITSHIGESVVSRQKKHWAQ